MRILIFTTAYLPHIGGAEVAIREIARRLPDVSFTVVTSRFNRKLPALEQVENVAIHRLGLGFSLDKFWLSFFGASYAKKIFKEEKPDLIWAMMASYGGLAALSYKKNNPNIPYLLSLQEGDDMTRLDRRGRMCGLRLDSWP
jgi:glycosyltransferase involved in cell wall biosynthesis